MTKPRPLPLAVALVAFAAAGVFSWLMARRMASYNELEGRIVYAFMQVLDPEFTYADRPVAVTYQPSPEAGNPGQMLVSYGDETLEIDAVLPPPAYAEAMPGLSAHEKWFKVLRFAPVTGRSIADLEPAMEAGEIADRLAVVTRVPRPGVNPETWGRVWRKEWTFGFYEFLPEGGFAKERYAYPSGGADDDAEQPRGGLPELDPRSWQYQAADLLMPEGSQPRIRRTDSPLVSSGWTFPAAVVSIFIGVAGLVGAFAPPRPRTPASAE